MTQWIVGYLGRRERGYRGTWCDGRRHAPPSRCANNSTIQTTTMWHNRWHMQRCTPRRGSVAGRCTVETTPRSQHTTKHLWLQ